MPRSGEVTVPAEGGLVFATIINGKGPFKALFDTGSINLISETLAQKLGLNLESEEVQVSTFSAKTIPARRAHIATLRIGDLVLHDQTFLVAAISDDMDESTPSLVVGYEVLRRLAVRVDYEHQAITFYDGPRFHYAGHGSVVPLTIQGTSVLADASIGDASGTFLLDTGNEFGFFTSTGFTQKKDLVHILNAHFFGYNGRGYGGPSPEAYLARVNTMHLGNVPAASVIAHLTTDPSDTSQLAGNIGQSILGQFTNVFDCMRDQLYLEKSSQTGKPEIFNRAGLMFDVLDRGLQIMTVLPGSPGAEAGLQKRDVITVIDGKPPANDVNQPAFLQAPGTVLHLEIRRGTQILPVTVTLRDIL